MSDVVPYQSRPGIPAQMQKAISATVSEMRRQINVDAILYDLPTLRAECLHLARENPIARGALHTAVSSVIGTGLQLQSHIDQNFLGLGNNEKDKLEDNIERLWNSWAENTDADACRRLNFYEMQPLAFRSSLVCGDVFALLPFIERPMTVSSLRVQLIEAPRVSNPSGRPVHGACMGGAPMRTLAAG